MEKLFIGSTLKKKETEKKEKDNQYKLKESMTIAIGLIIRTFSPLADLKKEAY